MHLHIILELKENFSMFHLLNGQEAKTHSGGKNLQLF